MLFDTQISGRMGSPSVAGSTRRFNSGTSLGSLSATALRPPPARRTWPFASGSASRSSSPRLIVERASPVRRETTARPPPTSGPHLGGREHASAPFIELAADSVPTILNGFLVDHAIDVRLFAQIRNPPTPSHTDACPRTAIRLLFGES